MRRVRRAMLRVRQQRTSRAFEATRSCLTSSSTECQWAATCTTTCRAAFVRQRSFASPPKMACVYPPPRSWFGSYKHRPAPAIRDRWRRRSTTTPSIARSRGAGRCRIICPTSRRSTETSQRATSSDFWIGWENAFRSSRRHGGCRADEAIMQARRRSWRLLALRRCACVVNHHPAHPFARRVDVVR